MQSARPEIVEQARILARALERRSRWFVLTGAGVSTDSGIPAYRDAHGAWQHKAPIQYAEFMRSEGVRRRYWARSSIGYERVENAAPNSAHRALARFQTFGRAPVLVTQNVDGLHQKAGSTGVIDLHGRLAHVQCSSCGLEIARRELQVRLLGDNPGLARVAALSITPDGDADVDAAVHESMRVPDCARCGGILKPAVVFFGESVPSERTAAAYSALQESDAVLVVGSSLMVFSGHRFVRRAAADGKSIVIVNRGVTRGDAFAEAKFDAPCGELLEMAVDLLAGS